ncbi:MAG: phosphatase PAP2 family protein [Ruminococcaceae bacterium]|nr:phosphatase PAP2 family protein [Oscillospiraceae bacterium]
MQFLYLLESIRTDFLDTVFGAITTLGGKTLMLVICIITMWCVNKKRGYYLLTTCFTGIIINQTLKILFRIPRPWIKDPKFTIVASARGAATGYSFPSGHTQNITIAMGAPARFIKNTAVRIVCITIIALVAFSRMYLGVHTPLDVVVSLVIGAALVMSFYPFFDRSDEKPGPVYIIMGVMCALALLLTMLTELYNWPADIDLHNLESAREAGYLTSGCSLATLISYYLDRKYVHSETGAVWWLQIIKLVVGLALILAIKEGLKPVFAMIIGDHPITSAIRYFLMVLFGALIWPGIITWISKKLPVKK